MRKILYFLCISRKLQGELGLEGYFSLRHICDEIQKLRYEPTAIAKAVDYLLHRQLIIADNFNFSHVDMDDCVNIQAAGFIHLRVLCERIEYVYGIIPVVPISDDGIATQFGDYVNRESQRGTLYAKEKVRAVEIFHGFLRKEMIRLREKNPLFNARNSGANYVLTSMEAGINRSWCGENLQSGNPNQLDLI